MVCVKWLQRYARPMLVGTTTIGLTLVSCANVEQTIVPATPATAALADHLTQTGAKLYGAYWCPYCQKQEAMFGDAITKVQVIECDPKGENAQPQLCRQARVSSFPTWKINGKLYRGLRSLDELAALSDYKGSTNFNP